MIYIKSLKFDLEAVSDNLKNESLSIFNNTTFQFIYDWTHSVQTFELKTSGSTGTPQLINVNRNKLEYSSLQTITYFNLQKNQNALVCLNTEFVAGKMMLVRALEAQMNLYICEPTDNPFLVFPNTTFDFVALTPIQLEKWANFPDFTTQIQYVKTLILGGAALNESLIKLCKKLPISVFETYGLTETLSHIAVKNIKTDTEFFTIHKDIELGLNENNCLKLKGFITDNKWLQTTDIVEQKTAKSFMLLGRADFIINSGGIKINPITLENEIIIKLNLKNSIYITSVPNERLGEKLVLVTTNKEYKNLNFDFLEKYHRPKIVFLIPSFPLTNSGKIDRIQLKKLIISLSDNN